jgi:hypothetical protein
MRSYTLLLTIRWILAFYTFFIIPYAVCVIEGPCGFGFVLGLTQITVSNMFSDFRHGTVFIVFSEPKKHN